MSSSLPPPSSFDQDEEFYSESRFQTIGRRLRQEPLVPLGCILTVFALLGATRAMRKNDHHTANKMFRRRIYAQGFTIAALVVGSTYWKGDQEKRKEFEKVEGEKRRVEKREKWLKELEMRDDEDRMLREEARRRGQRRAEREEARGEEADKFMPKVVGEEEQDVSLGKEKQDKSSNSVSEAAKSLFWGKGK